MVRVRAVVVVAASIAATATGALLAGSCAHHDRELPRAGVAAAETRGTGQPQAEAVAPPDGGAPVIAPGQPTDAARGALQPLAWACLSDAAPIVQALSRVVGMQVAAGDERDMARALVGRLLGLHPALAAALDLRRPAVVALLRAEPGDPGPAPAALLPIASRQEVLAAAGRAGLSVEERPWGVVLRGAAGAGPSPSSASPSMPSPSLPAPGERAAVIAVAFAGDYAAISAREEQAPRVAAALAPLREHKAEAPLAIHLDVARASPPSPEAARSAWHTALGAASDVLAGEVAYAVWPAPGGGVGAGGAFRVRGDAGKARARLLAAYRAIGGALGSAVARSLRLDPARYPMKISVRASGLAVGGAAVDTVEARVRWPRGSAATRRTFRRFVGEPLRMVLCGSGDRVLFALGADAPARLRAMLEADRHHGGAAGGGSATLGDDPSLRAALAFHPEGRISLTYLPTAEMARFLGGLLHAATDAEVASRATEAAVADAGTGAIVSVSAAQGARYEVISRLPASSLPGLPRIGGVLWRMALSPLLNPPAIPPLPLLPAHLPPPESPALRPSRPTARSPSQRL